MSNHPVRPVRVTAHIPARLEEVFALVSDTRNDPKWCPNVDHAELLSGVGVAPGSKFAFHQHIDRRRGGRLEFDAEVEIVDLTAYSIAWVVTDRYQQREITIDVEPEGEGTRITQVTVAAFHRDPGWAVRMGYPLLAKRTIRDQFGHLAAHFSS